MKNLPEIFNKAGTWIVVVLQMIIGLTVIKTGLDLAAGKVLFNSSYDTSLTAIFVILVGAYFLLASFVRLITGKNGQKSDKQT